MSVGVELAEARHKLGLSLDEVSTRTKISVERLSAIEQKDLGRLPSLVYLKGFLRAYAAEVQLDPDDIAQRYLGELDLTSLDLSVAASGPATPPVDELRLEVADDWQAEFASEDERASELPLAPSESAPRVASAGKYFAVVDPRRVVSPATISRRSSTRYLPVVLTLMIAAAAGWVLSANFDAISDRLRQARVAANDPQTEATKPISDATKPTAPAPVVPAVPADPHAPEAASKLTPKSDTVPVNAASSPNVDASRGRASANTDSARPTEQTAVSETASPDAASATEPATDANADLTGSWALTNRVESSTYEEFNNLNLGFHLQLQQHGNRVTGTGQKWMENGRPIPARSRTAITVEGALTGLRLELTFTERGEGRTSAGTFVLDVADDGTLRGTFASDATKAQGTSLARRIASPNRE